ncbi:MAG: hypothetical protein JST93_24120 [Acidobacteria bacterium]|nr:hypothetical protein [Acidobacteriota bacterium]
MNDDQMRDLFREMRDEPLPADSLARVRLAVAERVAQPVRRPFWLRWQVLAAGVVAAVVLVMVLRQPAQVPAPPVVVAKQEPRPVPPTPPQPIVTPQRKPPMRLPQATTRPKPRNTDPLIRLETPDPNVVIFLVADGAGE